VPLQCGDFRVAIGAQMRGRVKSFLAGNFRLLTAAGMGGGDKTQGENHPCLSLVIAAYHCEVAGETTDDVDYQVRYFASDSIDDVMRRLRTEQPVTYNNCDGEDVRWIFDGTVAVQLDPQLKDGAEVIGFITESSKKLSQKSDLPQRDAEVRRG